MQCELQTEMNYRLNFYRALAQYMTAAGTTVYNFDKLHFIKLKLKPEREINCDSNLPQIVFYREVNSKMHNSVRHLIDKVLFKSTTIKRA